MKTTALALVALVALSGAAFAGETHKTISTTPAACSEATVKAKVDCTATGSVEKSYPTQSGKADAKGPRLGIDINPWIMPSAF